MKRIALVVGALCVCAGSVRAQDTPRNHEVTIDVQPIAGSIAYAAPVAGGVRWLVEGGFGFPQIDRTIEPDSADMLEIVYLATGARFRPTAYTDVDVGIRASIADLRECDASDCLPGVFGGGYASAFVGIERVKVGARIMGGLYGETGTGPTKVIHVTPLILRFAFRW